MRALAILGAILLVGGVVPAHATENVIHLSGYCWEDGDFPPSAPGDEFEAVGVVTRIRRPLFWSPDRFSYTWHVSEMVSLGESVIGATHIAEYTGGRIAIHVDALPSNHDYGTSPPNATSPSSFTDGHGIYLEGRFDSCSMSFNEKTGQGAWVGEITFTGGNAYPQLQDDSGWSIGSQLSAGAPMGYCTATNGTLYVSGPLATEEVSWAGVKSLYR